MGAKSPKHCRAPMRTFDMYIFGTFQEFVLLKELTVSKEELELLKTYGNHECYIDVLRPKGSGRLPVAPRPSGARQCFGLLAPMRTFSYHPPIIAAQSAISHLVHFPVIHAHFHQNFTKLTSSYPNSSRPCRLLAPMRTFPYHPPINAACNIKFSFGTFSLNPPKYSPNCHQNNIFLSKFLAHMRSRSPKGEGVALVIGA